MVVCNFLSKTYYHMLIHINPTKIMPAVIIIIETFIFLPDYFSKLSNNWCFVLCCRKLRICSAVLQCSVKNCTAQDCTIHYCALRWNRILLSCLFQKRYHLIIGKDLLIIEWSEGESCISALQWLWRLILIWDRNENFM